VAELADVKSAERNRNPELPADGAVTSVNELPDVDGAPLDGNWVEL